MATNLKVIAVYDNGGESLDRYIIVTNERYKSRVNPNRYMYNAISSSENGLGVFMWIECLIGKHLGKKIKLSDLSEELQAKIKYALI